MEGKIYQNHTLEWEISTFTKVWVSVVVSLLYCHVASKFVPRGLTRLLTFIPVVCHFLALPLHLHSMHLGGMSAFFIAWLANFKLLSLAFDKGPLSDPSLSLPQFVAIGCFPIKKTHPNPSPSISKKPRKSLWNYPTKILLIAVFIRIYDYSDHLNPKLIMVLYGFHIYFMLELILATVAALARSVLGLELEPQFNDPYLSTSLQDFWGRRWNIMVTRTLRPPVYDPALSVSTRVVGRKWAPLPAVFCTFVVSALMHARAHILLLGPEAAHLGDDLVFPPPRERLRRVRACRRVLEGPPWRGCEVDKFQCHNNSVAKFPPSCRYEASSVVLCTGAQPRPLLITGTVRDKAIVTPGLSLFSKLEIKTALELGRGATTSHNLEGMTGDRRSATYLLTWPLTRQGMCQARLYKENCCSHKARLSNDLVSSMESPTSLGPSSSDVRDFSAFSIAITKSVAFGDSTESDHSFSCYGEEIKFLHYLAILKELNHISKRYENAEEQFWTKLRHRKVSMCYLILRYAKRNDDHGWFLEHKDVTDFESRRHLVMLMLPEVKDEYDELHEMLIDRSQLLTESFEYIARAT
ncbi:ubiquitin protein ligase 5 [Actinidia rufa]|uniref:Ubiquitin protein ligase 5 n=1 Tax=Actinidia rufa TaxID=165716 RepID=A0A7J0F099_9ERIC|nr:ubiquitin protein ligase 5 [Actinidia rufa]